MKRCNTKMKSNCYGNYDFTLHLFLGLAKVPYIRDTRRSIGIDNFILYASNLSSAHSEYGPVFLDSIAVGNYAFDRHVMPCHQTVTWTKETAYTIPFRALTNRDFDNLLVAGDDTFCFDKSGKQGS